MARHFISFFIIIFLALYPTYRFKTSPLHGDYLFDDIKSTLRETESLEDNIRSKFIEFAKDYGLIVIGYGGYDRSIMDVINYLLKHEDYYKNGIYWCLRKGDTIGEDLRKLLWKDRVYFVLVDGYDEFFAEVHSDVFKKSLPIDTNFISNKSQDIIKSFVENKFLMKSASKIIKEDLSNLRNQSEKNGLYDAIKELSSNNLFDDDTLSNIEVKYLIDISNLYNQGKYADALIKINKTLDINKNNYLKVELLKKSISVYMRLGENNKAIDVIDNLIRTDGEKPAYYINKSKLEKKFDKKIFLIEKAIENDSYNEGFYNSKARLLINRFDSSRKDKYEDKYREIIEVLDHSIEILPSISNGAWVIKFDFIFDNDPSNKELPFIIKCLSRQKLYSTIVLEMEYDLINKDSDREFFIDRIEYAKKICPSEDKIEYDIFILRVYDNLDNKDEIKITLFSLDNNELYKNKREYIESKANLYFKKFRKLDEAIDMLKDFFYRNKNSSTGKQLLTYYLYSGNIKKAEILYSTNQIIFSVEEKNSIEKEILEAKKDYHGAYKKVQEIEIKEGDISSEGKYIVSLSYFLIQMKRYKESIEMLGGYLHSRDFNISLETEIINYELSKKLLHSNRKVNKKRLENIASSTKSEETKAAIYSLNGRSR